MVPTLASRLQALFAALGALGGAFHEFGTYQFEQSLFGAIALPGAQARDARVTAVALPETRAQGIEQLLDGVRRAQHHRRLAARVQRILLGQGDHVFHQRAYRLRLRNRGDNALGFDDARGKVAHERIAAARGPL